MSNEPSAVASLTAAIPSWITFAITAAEDKDLTGLKDLLLYECVDVVAIDDTIFGPEVAGR